MIAFNKNMVKWVLLYVMLVSASFLAGLKNEWAGHVLFLLSTLFFSTIIVYALWRESKPIREIKYPIESAASSKNQLYDAVQEMLFGKVVPYVINRLQHILTKKVSLKLDVTEDEAKKLLQNPKNLQDLGYDKLAFLISKDNFSARKRSERIRLLHAILNQLEED